MNVRRHVRPSSWLGRLGACSLATLATATYCHYAHAREADARAVCLAWDLRPGEGCPAAEEIEAAVSAMLSHPLPLPGTCRTRATGSFQPHSAGNGWRVDLHFASETGESLGSRSLEIRDAACAALKEPLSLIIALMVEGNVPEKGALRLPKPASPQRAEGLAGKATTVSTGAAVSSGLLPNVGFGATLGLGSRVVADLPLRFDTTFWFPTVRSSAGPGGQFWAWVGSVGVCPSFWRGRYVRAAACIRLVAGVIRGTGLGLDEIGAATRPIGEGEVSLTVSVQLSRQASLYVSAGLAAPWIRSRFVYIAPPNDARVQVHEPSSLIPTAGLGLEFGSEDTHSRAASP